MMLQREPNSHNAPGQELSMHVGLLLSSHQRSRTRSGKMSLRILFLLAGSLAGPSLTPAPLLYLDMSSDPPARGDSTRLVCIAPRAYVDSEFWLLKMDLVQPVQTLFASEAQHHVTFILGNVTGKDAGQYRCRYRSYNGSARQMSEFSNVVEIAVAVNTRRQQLKRDRESCWTETNFPTTDMSFDNGLFTVSVKMDLEATGSQDACISPGSRKRLSSASSLGTNSFSTFKSLQ
ncbi:protein HIDE1 isoform X4 [Mauremys mutica]|uniref:protein HIDE1 isoform X4 n=1 Tax=Mauremys mutica TaxID=74926 RepID=UPI001D16C679|nr:protein HIDE1 isoform X4 [Mauremys mutica]